MGVDLITVLAVMGTVGVGNPLSLNPGFSIGGKNRKANNVLGNLFGLLGTSALSCSGPELTLRFRRNTSRVGPRSQLDRVGLIQHARRSLRYWRRIYDEYDSLPGSIQLVGRLRFDHG